MVKRKSDKEYNTLAAVYLIDEFGGATIKLYINGEQQVTELAHASVLENEQALISYTF